MQQHVPEQKEQEEKKKKSDNISFVSNATQKYVSIFYPTNSNKFNICVKIATQNIQ